MTPTTPETAAQFSTDGRILDLEGSRAFYAWPLVARSQAIYLRPQGRAVMTLYFDVQVGIFAFLAMQLPENCSETWFRSGRIYRFYGDVPRVNYSEDWQNTFIHRMAPAPLSASQFLGLSASTPVIVTIVKTRMAHFCILCFQFCPDEEFCPEHRDYYEGNLFPLTYQENISMLSSMLLISGVAPGHTQSNDFIIMDDAKLIMASQILGRRLLLMVTPAVRLPGMSNVRIVTSFRN